MGENYKFNAIKPFLLGSLLIGPMMAGCVAVKLDAPDKPIEINLNIKIDQELRVKLDDDIEDLISENPDIF